jgi:hypothetical protein
VLLWKGVYPLSSKYVMHPKAQTSTFSEYAYLFTSSGAMYNGEPKTKVIPSFGLNLLAKPKSINLT